MSAATELDPHSVHSADHTRDVANLIGEAVRFLNYASGTYADDAMPYASVVYDVIGSLRGATGGLDQLLRQLGGRLGEMETTGLLQVRSGPHSGDPAAAVAAVHTDLMQAAADASALQDTLRRLHSALADVGTVVTGDDE
jgi:hypothetical protein